MVYYYKYKVMIDGRVVGEFSEVSAPDIYSDPIEYREGDFAVNTVDKQPGLVKYDNITLRYGMAKSMDLYNWVKEVEGGIVNRKTVVISLQDDKQMEIAKWTVISAWPTRYIAPACNAIDKESAVETLELAHEGVTRDR